MTIIREEDMIIQPNFTKESINYAEMFDIERFSIPAELFISEKDIAW